MRIPAKGIYGDDVLAEVIAIDLADEVVLGVWAGYGGAARMRREDAVATLRAMLRELCGPSIDDVREAWGAECVDVVHASPGKRCVSVYCGGWPMSFTEDAEAEVLQAAYDAAPTREVSDAD